MNNIRVTFRVQITDCSTLKVSVDDKLAINIFVLINVDKQLRCASDSQKGIVIALKVRV